VAIRLKSGEELRNRQEINRGAAERPLSDSDIIEKFRGNAATATGAAATERLAAAVLGLEQSDDLTAFADRLAG
jgi:hypothetical protein